MSSKEIIDVNKGPSPPSLPPSLLGYALSVTALGGCLLVLRKAMLVPGIGVNVVHTLNDGYLPTRALRDARFSVMSGTNVAYAASCLRACHVLCPAVEDHQARLTTVQCMPQRPARRPATAQRSSRDQIKRKKPRGWYRLYQEGVTACAVYCRVSARCSVIRFSPTALVRRDLAKLLVGAYGPEA
eukprot:2326083-Rhodomonas_salina.1